MCSHEIPIALVNGLILADPAHPDVLQHDATVIQGDKLVGVNVASEWSPGENRIIDCTNCLIMPGLINCHTHAAMGLLRGVADDFSLDRWLNDYIFPSESKHVNADFVYLGTALSAVEMALNGITTFADAYFFMEQAAKAAKAVGLRAVIAQGILDVPAPDAPSPGSWRHRVKDFLAACPDDPLITPALFCHSPYLCSPQTFQAAADFAVQNNALLFSHVSETPWEISEILSRYGLRPVEYLKHAGVLGDRFVAVHAIHLSDQEKEILAESGTKVVHCPESNMKMASGAAPIQDMVRLGITTGIGTDGPASNNNLDLFEEMRSASFMAKLITGNPEALDARTVLCMATTDGARVLGMEDKIGSLAEGKQADVIVIDLDRPHLTPIYDVISHLVYVARGSDVRDVIVNGRIVVDRGRVTTVDEKEIQTLARMKGCEISEDLNLGKREL
jgi:5-methylthioadenosine/S-adenosylhomocysteine deaminase